MKNLKTSINENRADRAITLYRLCRCYRFIIFEDYTNSCELTHVKTTNMGSLYKLTYRVTLKNAQSEKQMLDEMRVRNGNLEIAIMNQEGESYEL